MKLIFLLITFVLSSSHAFSMQYKISSDNGKVGFEIIKFKIGGKVPGHFKTFNSTFSYDQKSNSISNVKATIQAESIFTDSEKRDRHLKSEDFFDVTKHPTLTFNSTGKTQLKNGSKIKGKLTIKGITRDVTLTFVDVKKDKNNLSLRATGRINRLDFGVSWNKSMEQSDWKKVFGILGKTVLDENVDLIIEGKAIPQV